MCLPYPKDHTQSDEKGLYHFSKYKYNFFGRLCVKNVLLFIYSFSLNIQLSGEKKYNMFSTFMTIKSYSDYGYS